MFKVVMIRDKFVATFKTGLPVTITYSCKLINIVTKLLSISEDAGTLNTPLLTLQIKMQSSPHHHAVGLKPTSGNSLSRSLVKSTDKSFEFFCIFIFTVPLLCEKKIFYSFYVETYFSITILCYTGI